VAVPFLTAAQTDDEKNLLSYSTDVVPLALSPTPLGDNKRTPHPASMSVLLVNYFSDMVSGRVVQPSCAVECYLTPLRRNGME
jgi:hypothetical protein